MPFQVPEVRDWFWRYRSHAEWPNLVANTREGRRGCDGCRNVSNRRTSSGESGHRLYENIGVGQFQTFTCSGTEKYLVMCSPSVRWIQSLVNVVEDISQIDRVWLRLRMYLTRYAGDDLCWLGLQPDW